MTHPQLEDLKDDVYHLLSKVHRRQLMHFICDNLTETQLIDLLKGKISTKYSN